MPWLLAPPMDARLVNSGRSRCVPPTGASQQVAVCSRQEIPATPATIATVRIEARISTDLHAMLKRAAELQGHTMTDFVVSAVQAAAHQAIEQADVMRLSQADQACFAQALLLPPQPAPALERAFGRRSKLLRAQ